MFGVASEGAVELDVVRWVSAVIKRRARLIVGLGLVGLLTSPARSEIRRAWSDGGPSIDWLTGQIVVQDSFRFRHFVSRRDDGRRLDAVLWPNHPSRAPFGGPPRIGGPWQRSVLVPAQVLRQGLLET
jgi:hypothetical protein